MRRQCRSYTHSLNRVIAAYTIDDPSSAASYLTHFSRGPSLYNSTFYFALLLGLQALIAGPSLGFAIGSRLRLSGLAEAVRAKDLKKKKAYLEHPSVSTRLTTTLGATAGVIVALACFSIVVDFVQQTDECYMRTCSGGSLDWDFAASEPIDFRTHLQIAMLACGVLATFFVVISAYLLHAFSRVNG